MKKIKEVVELQPTLCKLEYLQSKAGCGKTYTTLQYITTLLKRKRERKHKFSTKPIQKGKWLYIGKGIQLCKESRELVEGFYPEGVYKNIHGQSDDLECRTIFENVGIELDDKDFDILFMTHKMFIKYLYEGLGYQFHGCNILIDEMLDVFEAISSSVSRKEDTLLPYLGSKENGMHYLHKASSYLKRVARDESISEGHKNFLSILEKGYGCYIQSKGEERINYTCLYSPDIRGLLLGVNRCIIMGAKIEDTLSSNLWSNLGVKLIPFNEVTLPRQQYPNEDRVTIYYLTSEENRPNGCSRGLLESLYNPDTGKSVKYKDVCKNPRGIDGYTGYKYVIEEFISRTKATLGEDFLYTANRWVYDKGIIDPTKEVGVKVPYGCFGWNSLKDYTKAAGWFSYKPNPYQEVAMIQYSELVGFDVLQKYIEDKHFEPQLQLLGRGAIRDGSRPDVKLDWVVVDRNTAEYITKHHIPDAKICDSIALRIPDQRVSNGGLNIKEFNKEHQLSPKEAKFINKIIRRKGIGGGDLTEEYLLKRLDYKRRGVRWKESKS